MYVGIVLRTEFLRPIRTNNIGTTPDLGPPDFLSVDQGSNSLLNSEHPHKQMVSQSHKRN